MRIAMRKLTKQEIEDLENIPLYPTGESIPVDCKVGLPKFTKIMIADNPQYYDEKFFNERKIKMSEWTTAEKALAEEVEYSTEQIAKLKDDIKTQGERIKKLQSFCEHKRYIYHLRQAEDNSYNECKVCGKIF